MRQLTIVCMLPLAFVIILILGMSGIITTDTYVISQATLAAFGIIFLLYIMSKDNFI